MADKTNLSINSLRTIATGHKYRAMIAVGVRDDGTVDVVSYGESKDDCRVIGEYAQGTLGARLPKVPFQTWFGWGNSGVPKALSAEEYASLGEPGRRYTDKNTHPGAAETN